MTTVTGFPALAKSDARVLILGSMPGLQSLAVQQYYGHPRNAFWAIMITLFGAINNSADYQQKKSLLTANNIALWDVLKHCHRPGSMDAAIDQQSIVCNDFAHFFKAHPRIRKVCFNGGAAQKIYLKQVAPLLPDTDHYIQYHRLPSTSPAYAAMSLAEKTEHWRVLQSFLQE